MLLGVSGLAGVLIAGLAIPAAALAGVMSTVVSSSLSELPAQLLIAPQAQRTTVLMANGEPLTQFYDENRIIVELSEIAPIMQTAQIAIEDDRYYSHGALDFRSLAKAVLSYFGSDSGGGGSTLTQQYVKQVLMEAAVKKTDPEERQAALEEAQARTIQRKIMEMRYAIAVEADLDKDKILERYLNIAYYGDGAYGVEAAAHHYFDTTAAELTLAQAAMLAGIVQTPARNPVDDLEGALERRDTVLTRMLTLELITQEEYDEASEVPYDPTKVRYVKNGCSGVKYSQMCYLVWRYLMTNEALGNKEQDRADTVRRGGFTIQTYIDPKKQDAAQKAVSDLVASTDPVNSAMVMMEPGTGKIVAAAQNRYEFGIDAAKGETTWLSFATPALGGDQGYQAGSTFKAFTVGAALESGVPPTKIFDAKARINFTGRIFKSCDGPFPSGTFPVSNASRSGVMDMYMAAAQSVNTYFVLLEQLVGICPTVTIADKAGLTLSSPDSTYPNVMSYHGTPSFTLGVIEVSALSMATAFSTFAASGTRCDPVIIASIKDPDDIDIPTQQPNCHQTISEDIANGINLVLSNVFTSGTASGRGLPGRPASGKTGTTDSERAVWLVGYTPNLVGVAMIGVDPNPQYEAFWKSHGRSLSGLRLPVSGTYLTGTGAGDAARIWRAAMIVAIEDYPVQQFTRPPYSILSGRVVTPPKTDGMTEADAVKVLEAAGFYVKKEQVFDESPPNTLIHPISCQPVFGGTCTMNISKGPRPPDPTQKPTEGEEGEEGEEGGG